MVEDVSKRADIRHLIHFATAVPQPIQAHPAYKRIFSMLKRAQAFGRAIRDLNFEGLIAPSSRDQRGRNLIRFPDDLRPESRIEIVGKEKLKQWLV